MFLLVVNGASLIFFFCSLYKCRVAHHTDESESVKIKLASRALRLRGARTQRRDKRAARIGAWCGAILVHVRRVSRARVSRARVSRARVSRARCRWFIGSGAPSEHVGRWLWLAAWDRLWRGNEGIRAPMCSQCCKLWTRASRMLAGT